VWSCRLVDADAVRSREDGVEGYERFVALGDSFTEGLHDELGPDGRHRGWADRVAEALAVHHGGLQYANLAVRGRLLGQVVAEQVPIALDLDPDLVSFHAGANDVLRPRVDLERLARDYDAAVATLRTSGAKVVLFTVLERAGGSGRLADGVARRMAAFNGHIVRPAAQRHGARLIEVGSLRALHDRRLWNEDRLHLAPDGHRRVAAAVLEALDVDDEALLAGAPGWWRSHLPTAAPASRRATAAAEVRWVRRHLLPWVGRRVRGVSSGDTIVAKRPELVELQPRG
jgi:lysophospholipase L1-like esterase